jgi:hypothetical protein
MLSASSANSVRDEYWVAVQPRCERPRPVNFSISILSFFVLYIKN